MFEPNEKAEIEVIKVKDKSVIIIDDFYKNPDEIRDLAIELEYSENDALIGGFPGMRGSLGTPEVKDKLYPVFLDLCKAYGDLKEEVFEKNWNNLGFMVNITKDSYLSANPMGIIPHQDYWENEPGWESTYQYGAVIYLNTSDECVGGTNLYSYEGAMSIPSDYQPEWLKTTGEKFNITGPILGSLSHDQIFQYVRDRVNSNVPYKLEFEAEMKYNRMFLYPSNVLHTADLDLGMFIDNYRINQVFFM